MRWSGFERWDFEIHVADGQRDHVPAAARSGVRCDHGPARLFDDSDELANWARRALAAAQRAALRKRPKARKKAAAKQAKKKPVAKKKPAVRRVGKAKRAHHSR